MKSTFATVLLAAILSAPAVAESVDTTVCDILASPQSFDGKKVRIKGTVFAGLDEFVVRDPSCGARTNAIWLTYPEGTKGKAGPAAVLQMTLSADNPAKVESPARPPVHLADDERFRELDSLLATPAASGALCLGCSRYSAT